MTSKETAKIKSLPLFNPILLDDDDDDLEDDDDIKPIKRPPPSASTSSSTFKSGLLSKLPPPRSNPFLKKDPPPQEETKEQTSVEPVADKKPAQSSSFLLPRALAGTSKGTTTAAPKKEEEKKAPVLLVGYGSDSESETEAHESEEEEETNASKKVKLSDFSHSNVHHPQPQLKVLNNGDEVEKEYDINDDPEPVFDEYDQAQSSGATSSAQVIDEEGWLALVGGNKRRLEREMKNALVKEVSVNDVVGDNKSELIKQITSDFKPPAAGKDYFSSGSKRASQITFLARVAKEREEELKNQWSESKFNRNAARSRYGF